jgi:hypothetical protein
MKNPYYKSLLLICLSSCHFVSDKISDSFKTVNASLEKSNKVISTQNAYEQYYFEIELKGDKNKELVRRADTLYSATKKAIDLIDKIKKNLTEKDSAGNNTNVAANLLVHTSLGDSLDKVVRKVPDQCYTALVSISKKSSLDSTLHETKLLLCRKDWMEETFSNTPTVGALTILNYLKLEFMTASAMALSDIDTSLK